MTHLMTKLKTMARDCVKLDNDLNVLEFKPLCEAGECRKKATAQFVARLDNDTYYTYRCEDHRPLNPLYDERPINA